jgi:hypothetical protein
MSNFKVSAHAISRFIERLSPESSERQASQLLVGILEHGTPPHDGVLCPGRKVVCDTDGVTIIVRDDKIITCWPSLGNSRPRRTPTECALERRQLRQDHRLRNALLRRRGERLRPLPLLTLEG